MSSEFFPKQRRRLELEDYKPLLNSQSEKRFRFDFIMPLTGESFLAMPDFIRDGFEKMEVENSAIGEIDLSTELEEIFFEAYSTDTHKKPMVIETLGLNLEDEREQLGHTFAKFANCTLRSFKLVRRQEDVVCLKFSLTTRADGGLALWAHTYHGATLFGEFTHSTIKIKAESSEQMQLTEPTLLSGGGVGTQDCPFARSGEKCILNAEHDGEHVMGPIIQDVTAGRKRRQLAEVAH